jgi:uncharacterized protein (TIGR02147 family)
VDSNASVDIFRYRDYREYLRDVYSARKKSEYGFSYRAFAKKAGLSAPNYLKLVADGQRNLMPEMASRFAAALGLGGESADYFCDLVSFNQAATAPERERCYQRLRRYRRYKNAFRLDAAHAAYHAEWFIPAVRELIACDGFREDAHWIAHALRPSITQRQAEHALAVLGELGFIEHDAKGRLVQSQPLVTTGDEKPLGHHIVNFHRAMLERAADALDHVERSEREIASLTLSLSAQQFAAFKQRLYDVRQELLQASLEHPSDAPVDRVVQINFQMFPLARVDEGKSES